MSMSPFAASNDLWQFEVVLRVIFMKHIVYITLEENFKEGNDEAEEHPDLHNFDAARVRQCIRNANEPANEIAKN
jgi:hypothetical protein